MPYEREAIADSASAIPNQPQAQFKEERVVTPYASRPKPAPTEPTATTKIGQPDTTSGSEGPPSPTEASVTLSPAAAALARKEQKNRQYEQTLKAKEDALTKRSEKLARLEELETKLAAKDYSGIENLIKYDEYTNYLIDKEAGTDPTVQEIKKLEAKIEEVTKAQKSDVDKRYEAAVNDRRKAVTELVAKDPSYSGIKKLKYEEHVVQHILDTWEHDSIDLTPEQAAKEVEQILKEKAKEWASLLETKIEEPVDAKNLPPLKPGLKTLTNNVTATEIKRPQRSFQGMSDSERYAEARRRAEEKLKSRG